MRFLLSIFLAITFSASAQVYISPRGNDASAGTAKDPLASPAAALRKAREMRRLGEADTTAPLRIIVADGIYQLHEAVLLRPEDSGTPQSPTVIEAAAGAAPVFSGGRRITGWKKAAVVTGTAKGASGKLWVADISGIQSYPFLFRQLYVNGSRAIRARDRDETSMLRILSWDHKARTCWIPKPTVDLTRARGLEMTILQWWAIAHLRVRSMVVKGDSALLHFEEPESRVQSEHPWPAPWQSKETGNSAFYLSNALPLLDQPGEWYLDAETQKLYYWPPAGEDLSKADVIAPAEETLVEVQGTADHPVSNIIIKGISFEHSSWLRPSLNGHVPHQAGLYMTDAYKLKKAGTPLKASLENQAWVGRPPGAVQLQFASKIQLEGCRFRHLAATGLDYREGVTEASAIGNSFTDIGGSAIMAGHFSSEGEEVHLPYNPSDEREITGKLEISNNLVHHVAVDDWGCAGIAAGYIRDSKIEHNEITDLPYMGISLGWGWSPLPNAMRNNSIRANRISRYARQLYDVAAIYTLSAQPGTVICQNVIDSAYKAPFAHLPSHWFYLYTDEGSSGITVKDNWTPSKKYLQNANGSGNTWFNNGPAVDNAIRKAAGIEAPWRSRLQPAAPVYPNWEVAVEQPVTIEIVSNNIDIPRLRGLLKQYGMDTTAIYSWQDHYVIFDYVQDVSVLRGRLQNAFPGAELRVYYEPFYEFNRQRCRDTATSRQWDHILLTANLVESGALQQEYLDYHKTQFEKWPELSKGFCNAQFQRLLIYRNGRQLMLVISIPKGSSLDELNPKTTENNPRVNDWNNLMKRYQEGISGTKKGEVWVFLKQLK